MFGGSNTSSIGVWMSRELYTTLFLVDTPKSQQIILEHFAACRGGKLEIPVRFFGDQREMSSPHPNPPTQPTSYRTPSPPGKKKRTLTNLPKCSV